MTKSILKLRNEFCTKLVSIPLKIFLNIFGIQSLIKILTFRIEKSRVVIPTLLEAARKKDADQKLSWKRVYDLLFTRENLKLVQKTCHDKAARDKNLQWQTFIIDYPS